MSKPANLIGASKQVKLGASSPRAGSLYEPGRRSDAWLKCSPFTNLPEPERDRWDVGLTKADMKNCRWEIARAQIEFTEQTPDGHLRHASFTNCEMIKNHER